MRPSYYHGLFNNIMEARRPPKISMNACVDVPNTWNQPHAPGKVGGDGSLVSGKIEKYWFSLGRVALTG